MLSGVVYKAENAEFEHYSRKLVLTFAGKEVFTYWNKHVNRRRRYLKKLSHEQELTNIPVDLANFGDKFIPKEKVAYPFQIVLPTYLPPSVVLEQSRITGLRAEIKYSLTLDFAD